MSGLAKESRGRLLWATTAIALAALGAAWASPTTTKGEAVWFGVALAAAPLPFLRTTWFRRVCTATSCTLAVLSLLGAMFGFEVLLPAAAVIASNAKHPWRHRKSVITGLTALSLVAGYLLAMGIYRERFQQFAAYQLTATPGSGDEMAGEVQSFMQQHIDPIVDEASFGSDGAQVGFRSDATAAQRRRLREELQSLPSVANVVQCTGTLNC